MSHDLGGGGVHLPAFSPYLWALLYFSFVHQRIDWRWRSFLIFAGVANFYSGLATIFFPAPLSMQLIGNLPFVILLSVIIPLFWPCICGEGTGRRGFC